VFPPVGHIGSGQERVDTFTPTVDIHLQTERVTQNNLFPNTIISITQFFSAFMYLHAHIKSIILILSIEYLAGFLA